MATIGILCGRMRMEEKECQSALTALSLPTQLIEPGSANIPALPSSGSEETPVESAELPAVLIDRIQEREVAGPLLTLHRAAGQPLIDAGIAAIGNRLDVALALANAGIPRPVSALAISEASALRQLERIDYPATLLPMALDSPRVPVQDKDSAEALFEHRSVLGCAAEQTALIQQGVAGPGDLLEIMVVDGQAVGIRGAEGVTPPADWLRLAVQAAIALDALMISVVVKESGDRPVVWDVDAVPEFRSFTPLGDQSIAEAIANAAARSLTQHQSGSIDSLPTNTLFAREAFGGFILSA